MTWAATAEVDRFDEAVDWFRSRTVITAEEAAILGARTKAAAFWVGGGLQLEQIQRVFDKASDAIERGDTFEAFRAAVRSELTDNAHVETVFRNAAQRAYNSGRFEQMTVPAVKQLRPFWMFDAVLDTRTTDVCSARSGTLLSADDPWWDSNYPPLHHRCRSTVRSLRSSAAEDIGVDSPPDVSPPPKGWGASPKVQAAPWRPDRSRVDPHLVDELARKRKTTPARLPRPSAEHLPSTWTRRYRERYGAAAPSLGWGRAMQERGLDMPISEVRLQLSRIGDTPNVVRIQRALHGLSGDETLRENLGELIELRQAAAALASHLDKLPAREVVTHPDLAETSLGARVLRFFSQMTGPNVRHPDKFAMVLIGPDGRSGFSEGLKTIWYNPSNPGALEHEWGHGIEELNSELSRRAFQFRAVRTAGEPLKAFPPLGEKGREDQFSSWYIGRFYDGFDSTEVTSMGVQVIADRPLWGSLERQIRHDQEHFWFTLGQLRGT